MLLNNKWFKNEIKEIIQITKKQIKMNTQQPKTYETQGKQSLEGNS